MNAGDPDGIFLHVASVREMRQQFDPEKVRQQFPVFCEQQTGIESYRNVIHLNNAATTHKPKSVIEAITSYYSYQTANVHRASAITGSRLTEAFEDARENVRQFFNASHPEEIIWTKGATESINLVASSWGRTCLGAGDEILMPVSEHHANIVPWQQVAKETGATIRVVPLNEDANLSPDMFSRYLTERTRLVCIAHVANATGMINPVREIIRQAHEAGALVLVDGAQATPHFTIDVQKLDCDFYVMSGHKMYGPNGVGVLYGQRRLLESMPPWQTGGGMVEKVSFSEDASFNPLPFRFEAGTPNIPAVLGLSEAIRFIGSFDRAEIHAHETRLLERLYDGMATMKNLSLVGPRNMRAGAISFFSDRVHHQDMSMLLADKGIILRSGHHCAMPLMSFLGLKGTVRVSVAMYNSQKDIEIFLESLEDIWKSDIGHYVAEPQGFTPENENIRESDVCNAIFDRIFTSKNWSSRQKHIMHLGNHLPKMDEQYRTDEFLVPGCESRVWIKVDYDRATHQLFCHAGSESSLMRGLVALILMQVNGKTPETVLANPPEKLFETLNLNRFLSESRTNGLKILVDTVREAARKYLQEEQEW